MFSLREGLRRLQYVSKLWRWMKLCGTHLYRKTEEVDCRIDHYQTMDKVYVSIFAKQVDKERSTIKFDSPEQVRLFQKTI